MDLNKLSFITFLIVIMHLYYFQLNKLDTNIPSNCLKIFKSNNYLGLIVFITLLTGKL